MRESPERDSAAQLGRLERALVLNGVGIWDWDPVHDRATFSEGVEPILGLPVGYLDELAAEHGTGIAETYARLVHPDDLAEYRQQAADLAAGRIEEVVMRHRLILPSGELRWIESTGTVECDADGRPQRVLGAMRDLSAQMREEQRVVDLARGTAGDLGDDFFPALVRELARTYGASAALVGRVDHQGGDGVEVIASWLDGAPGRLASYPLAGSPCAVALEDGMCIESDGVAERYPDDHLLVEFGARGYVGIRLTDGAGTLLGILNLVFREPVALNASQRSLLEIFAARAAGELVRMRADAELRERQRFLNSIAETVPCVLYVYDVIDRRPVWNNDKAHLLLGLHLDELAEQADPDDVESIFHPDDGPGVAEVWSRWDERSDRDVVRQSYRVRNRADGSWRWIRTIERVFRRDPDGRVREIVGAAEDFTEHREMEAQLLHAAKMESLGHLAGGVAHDFNNLLTSILGYCDLGAEGAGEPQRRAFRRIRQAAARGAELAQTLLGVARRQTIEPEWVEIGGFVERLGELLPRLLGPGIDFAIDRAGSQWVARIDRGQFEQVIFNLASNARDAMPHGGRWILRVSDRRGALEGDDAIEILATDTGGGVPAELRNAIFDPFFTTKPQGKGTGLGLPLCYGVVTQAGGSMELAESSDSGTTFRILLPAKADGVGSEDGSGQHQLLASEGDATIAGRVLVVDDDENVRFVVEQLLSRMGLSVVSADGGEAALELLIESPVDLVVTDMVMPGMDGAALAQELFCRHPELPVLVMSGYLEREPNEFAPSVVGHITKPFPVDRMRTMVREILGRG